MEKFRINNIKLDVSCKNKQEVFEFLSEISKNYTNDQSILDLYQERENQISTGLEDGFAIPHAKGEKIKSPALFYLKLKNPISDWETFDNKPVQYIISFLIPEKNGDYLQDLAKVAQAIQDEKFRESLTKSNDEKEIYELIESIVANKEFETLKSDMQKDKIIAGITSCAAGLAHTYMAKEALERACKSLGYGFKVEAHGSLGIENKLTKEELKKVMFLVVAADVEVDLDNNYNNKFIYRCTTNEMIKNGEEVFKKALKQFENFKNKKNNENIDYFDLKPHYDEIKTNNKYLKFVIQNSRDLLKHMMTGIGYCVPLLIGCGLMIGVAQLIAQFTLSGGGQALGGLYQFSWDNPSAFVSNVKGINGFLYTMQIMGMNIGLQMLFPMFLGGFIGYSINGKAGLSIGFICGALSVLRNTGFVGVVISALIAGYMLKLIIKYMTPKGKAKVLGSVLFVPLFGSLVAIIVAWWMCGYPLMKLNEGLKQFVLNVQSQNGSKISLSALIAAMMAFDLGGPVNKAAWAAYTVIWSDTTLPDAVRYTPNAAGNIAIGIPVLGVGLSVFIGNKYFSQQEKVQGSSCLVMGILGISEGAIPFFIRKPLRYWIVNISGAILGACFYVAVGGYLKVGAGVIYGWTFANKPVMYVLAFLIGVGWIAILNSQWEKVSWHKRNNIKYQIFLGKAQLLNSFIFIRNIFNSKKINYVETKFDKITKGITLI
ncbi:PTS fructose transporter subunit IIABC [Spiroplasma endosymbiont of Crioceris asparagi]|uniref:PTS fructose transporter subunit IIABC n=1 Tax=Spiroplasma endosymbiont of Crioceris asparagi TaxID=3066286 RepID=UPI0030CCB3F3